MRAVRSLSMRPWIIAAVLVSAVLLLVYAASVLRMFNLRVVDDDQALYWLMSEDVRHLRLHVPFVYGQAYNLAPEIYPAAVLLLAGRWVGFAVAVSAMGTGFLAWGATALFAYRMGRPYLLIPVLIGPLLLPVSYAMELGRPENSGILVASLALCVLTIHRVRTKGFLFGLLFVLAYAVHANSLLLTVPAGIYLVLAQPPQRRFLVALAAGGALGGTLLAMATAVVHADPDSLVHGSPGVAWSVPLFVAGLADPGTYFGRMVPTFLLHPWVLLAVLVAAAALAARRRQVPAAAAAAGAVLLIVASLGLTKAHDGDTGVFFSYQRLFLAVPEVLAFVLVVTLPERRLKFGHLAVGVVAGLVALPLQLGALPAAVHRYTPSAVQGVTNARVSAPLLARCSRVAEGMASTGTTTYVQLGDRGEAYACEALLDGRIQTYFPAYDRRGWVADAMARAPQRRVFFSDVSAEFCSRAVAVGAECAITDPQFGLGVIDLKGRTVGAFLRSVQVPVLEPVQE